MHHSTVRIWAFLLAATGLGICLYKIFYLGLPVTPQQETEVWTVQAQVNFTGKGAAAIVDFHLPSVIPGFWKLDEDFISNRFGLGIEKVKDNRKAQWAGRRAKGDQTLYYRITVTKSMQEDAWTSRPVFPKPPDYPEPYATAIRKIIEDVRNESANVSTYTKELLQQLNSPQPNENVNLIRNQGDTPAHWVNEIINILKGVRIPARILWGIDVTNSANNAALKPLLQVHNGKEWLTFNPVTSESGIPENFLSWMVGDNPLYTVTGGKAASVRFSVTKNYKEVLEVARQGAAQMDSILIDLSLFSMPVQSQNVFRLLLMVPLGAMIVVLMRTFIGINTFGTFMPVLIALAFRETHLLWGLLLFILIVSIGLMLRFYLERMMLLLVPRLTSILIIVVILMLLISLISNRLGVERTLSVALFPMVILSMTIERMSITWEESGAREALMQGFGSLLVACLGYLVMANERLGYLMFVFPELLLVLLAMSLLMGRYTGYRLVELRRFRAMRGNDKP